MSTFVPNIEQAAAVAAFASFLQSPDEHFVLSGPAGTGKTSLLRHIRDSADVERMRHILGGNLKSYEWLFTATTNKAAEVLGRSVGDEVSTIHSALGLRVSNNHETGATNIKRVSNTVLENKIIVIDEASMLDPQTIKHIYEGTYQCKIVYVGDHCQLAPVGHNTSPAFSVTDPVHLTEIMRSKDQPALCELNERMRANVDLGLFTEIPHIPGVIDYLTDEQAQAELMAHFVNNSTDSKFVAFSNNMVNAMNSWIRQQKNIPEHAIIGDTLISNNVTKAWSGKERTYIEQSVEVYDVTFVKDFSLKKIGVDLELDCFELRTSAGVYIQPAEPNKIRELIKLADKHKKWDLKFALKDYLGDFRPPYASTVYKAQGSTYDTVFIHLRDIATCRVPSQVLRMLYVAVSRARKRICLIGQLPDKYKGITNAPT